MANYTVDRSDTRGGCEQAEGAGPVDGLVAAVGAELVVEVAHVRPDGVRRQVELVGDLRRGQVGGQVAQDTGLGLAERFAQSSRLAGWCGGAVRPRRARPGEQAQDAGDLDRVRGALPGLPLEQLRRRVDEERQEHAVELGEIEGALESAPGGGRVAERVAGDRLQ